MIIYTKLTNERTNLIQDSILMITCFCVHKSGGDLCIATDLAKYVCGLYLEWYRSDKPLCFAFCFVCRWSSSASSSSMCFQSPRVAVSKTNTHIFYSHFQCDCILNQMKMDEYKKKKLDREFYLLLVKLAKLQLFYVWIKLDFKYRSNVITFFIFTRKGSLEWNI